MAICTKNDWTLLEAKDDGGNADPMTQIDSLKPKLVGLRPIVGETKE